MKHFISFSLLGLTVFLCVMYLHPINKLKIPKCLGAPLVAWFSSQLYDFCLSQLGSQQKPCRHSLLPLTPQALKPRSKRKSMTLWTMTSPRVSATIFHMISMGCCSALQKWVWVVYKGTKKGWKLALMVDSVLWESFMFFLILGRKDDVFTWFMFAHSNNEPANCVAWLSGDFVIQKVGSLLMPQSVSTRLWKIFVVVTCTLKNTKAVIVVCTVQTA